MKCLETRAQETQAKEARQKRKSWSHEEVVAEIQKTFFCNNGNYCSINKNSILFCSSN